MQMITPPLKIQPGMKKSTFLCPPLSVLLQLFSAKEPRYILRGKIKKKNDEWLKRATQARLPQQFCP